MQYLTANHTTPLQHGVHAGKRIPTGPLITQGNTARLAELGIYPHHRNTQPAPLGIEWTLIDGEWHELPKGTPEEREAATLNARRAEMQSRRSARRVNAQTAGFTFDGNRYAGDREESIPLLLNCVISAQMAMAAGPEAAAGFEAALGDGWRSTDGVGRVKAAAGILALHAAFVSHGAACDRHSQDLKAQIAEAETLAELEAIDLGAGWPE
jgi:hypothetical protein